MRTIRFSSVRRSHGSHFLITDDAIIWHSRDFPDSDRRAGVQVQQKRWEWAVIDRFEFVPVPEWLSRPPYFKGLAIFGLRILRARQRYGARHRQKYWLCAWPTAEADGAAAAERLPWPDYEQDRGRTYSLRVWRTRHVKRFTSHRELFEGKYWVIVEYHGFSRRQWRIIARAVRKRSGGRLDIDFSVIPRRVRLRLPWLSTFRS